MTTKPTLFIAIDSAWKKAVPDDSELFDRPPHLMAIEEEARKLDAILAKKLESPIQMYQDGLISAAEFTAMVVAASLSTDY